MTEWTQVMRSGYRNEPVTRWTQITYRLNGEPVNRLVMNGTRWATLYRAVSKGPALDGNTEVDTDMLSGYRWELPLEDIEVHVESDVGCQAGDVLEVTLIHMHVEPGPDGAVPWDEDDDEVSWLSKPWPDGGPYPYTMTVADYEPLAFTWTYRNEWERD